MKVIIGGRIHLNGALLDHFRHELDNTKAGDFIHSPKLIAMNQCVDHDDEFENELLEMEIIGSPDEDMVDGRVLLVFGPLSIEVDAAELRRGLLPFIKRNH